MTVRPSHGALAVAAALLAIAGCGSGGGRHSAASSPSTAAQPSSPAKATQAQGPPGPFKITPVFCGKYSKAQVNRYSDVSGYVFRYTNISNSVVGSPTLTVNFTVGSTVTGSNVNGSIPNIGPGQNATGAVGNGGNVLRFTRCEPLSYQVSTADGDQLPGTFTVPATLSRQAQS